LSFLVWPWQAWSSVAVQAKRRRTTTTTTLDARGFTSLNSFVTETLRQLESTIAARRHADADTSYVAKLNAGGVPLMARKFGEEAVETVIAALAQDTDALTAEAADVIFHLLVLLNAKGIAFTEVEAELARREGVSGIAEKAAREK
jgi:phosphoribosyl-ATP pyrophosphohydrolase